MMTDLEMKEEVRRRLILNFAKTLVDRWDEIPNSIKVTLFDSPELAKLLGDLVCLSSAVNLNMDLEVVG
tara:strand:- start:1273 stop:1479 length:207 start_codon:yes stop_codon:yes gene_type:complete